MKEFIIMFLFVSIVFFLSYAVGMVIEGKTDRPINHWKNIDTEQVVGQVQDSCRCTIINGKLYRVKIKMVQQEFYQPYK